MSKQADSLVGDRKRRHENGNPALPRPFQQPDNYSSTTVPSNSDTPVMVEILKLLKSMKKKLNEARQTNATRKSNFIPNPAPRSLAHRSSNNFSSIPYQKPQKHSDLSGIFNLPREQYHPISRISVGIIKPTETKHAAAPQIVFNFQTGEINSILRPGL